MLASPSCLSQLARFSSSPTSVWQLRTDRCREWYPPTHRTSEKHGNKMSSWTYLGGSCRNVTIFIRKYIFQLGPFSKQRFEYCHFFEAWNSIFRNLHPQDLWFLGFTHLNKKISQIGFIFPNFRGEHKKDLSCHHLGIYIYIYVYIHINIYIHIYSHIYIYMGISRSQKNNSQEIVCLFHSKYF